MKFDYLCDNMPDGLVLIDESYFDELNEDILYSFEILLDPEGRTELIYDFDGEDWRTVWERESVLIKEFCNAGELIQCLLYPDLEMEKVLEINVDAENYSVKCEGIKRIKLSKNQ